MGDLVVDIICKKSALSKVQVTPTNDRFLQPKNCCDIVKKIGYPQVGPKLVYSQ